MFKIVAAIIVCAALVSGCATPKSTPQAPSDAVISALIDDEIEKLLTGGDPYGVDLTAAVRGPASTLASGQTFLDWLRQEGANTSLFYRLPETDKTRLSNLNAGTELALLLQGGLTVGVAIKREDQWWVAHQEAPFYRLTALQADSGQTLRVYDLPIVGGNLERTLAASTLSPGLKADIKPVLARGFPASTFPRQGWIRLRLSHQRVNGIDMATPVLASAALSSERAPRFIVRYPPPGQGGAIYYDGHGRLLKAAWISEPVMGEYRITSEFNPERRHPITGRVRPHNGRDFAARRGTPVVAASDGEVVHAGWKSSWGKLVVLRHANGIETRYAHLASINDIEAGDLVSQGQHIGGVGSTGFSTGPHLHFEVYQHGLAVNPAGFDPVSASSTLPVEVEEHLAQYQVFEQASLAMREDMPLTAGLDTVSSLTGLGGPDDDAPLYSIEPMLRFE